MNFLHYKIIGAHKKFKHQPRPLVRSSSLKFGEKFWNLSHETVPLIHCNKRLAIFPSRPGRVWLSTSRLGTGKSLTFFYSVKTKDQSWRIIPELYNFYYDGYLWYFMFVRWRTHVRKCRYGFTICTHYIQGYLHIQIFREGKEHWDK
jgi:hypothetical protein